MDKALVTIAIGKNYQIFALNLFYSFIIFNKDNDIKFYIITDKPIKIHPRYKSRITIIISDTLLYNDEILLNKLFIDRYVPVDNILLVDADSFICTDLDPIFDNFKYDNFILWGTEVRSDDTWRGDIDHILKTNKIERIYRTNGGLYFFKNNKFTREIFTYCRSLISSYDAQGFSRVYNNLKDDEIILSLACVKFDLTAKPYDSKIKAETMYFSRRHIDLTKGICKLYYNNFEFQGTNMLLERQAFPSIICFDRFSVNDLDYFINIKAIKLFLPSNFIFRLLISLGATTSLWFYYLFRNSRQMLWNLKKSDKSSI